MIVAAIFLFFLGIETQRKIFFEAVGYPAIPGGKFTRVSVLSSNLEQDKYVLTMKRSSNPPIAESDSDSGLPALGILYTVECAPKFDNLCSGLTPGEQYYARWTSGERMEIAIGEAQADGKAMDPKKTRRFNVRGWKKTEELDNLDGNENKTRAIAEIVAESLIATKRYNPNTGQIEPVTESEKRQMIDAAVRQAFDTFEHPTPKTPLPGDARPPLSSFERH